MVEKNTKKVRGNPVEEEGIPAPPVPSIVRQSMVPKPPPPIAKENGEERVVGSQEEKEEEVVTKEPAFGSNDEKMKVSDEAKGTITIKVFENSPYEVEFEGMVTGSEVDMAWKAMMREYRIWKHNLLKKQEVEKKDGGI